MKKIIANKVYDTATAKQIATWDNGVYGDLDSIAETLYRKKTGEFFVHGEGGARTRYASVRGQGGFGSGEMLVPIAYDQAVEWAQEHLSADEYERIFGAVPEGDVSNLAITIDPRTLAAARNAATASGKTLSAWVEETIQSALEK